MYVGGVNVLVRVSAYLSKPRWNEINLDVKSFSRFNKSNTVANDPLKRLLKKMQ